MLSNLLHLKLYSTVYSKYNVNKILNALIDLLALLDNFNISKFF